MILAMEGGNVFSQSSPSIMQLHQQMFCSYSPLISVVQFSMGSDQESSRDAFDTPAIRQIRLLCDIDFENLQRIPEYAAQLFKCGPLYCFAHNTSGRREVDKDKGPGPNGSKVSQQFASEDVMPADHVIQWITTGTNENDSNRKDSPMNNVRIK
jgi:hypothetical protein